MEINDVAVLAAIGKAAVDLAKDEKVRKEASGLLGKLFPYFGLEKKALDTYVEEIKKSDLSPNIKARLILTAESDFKKWKNQESIAEIAFKNAKEGTDFSEKSGVDEEWFERYMDAAKFVSSEEMQLIWGKILAGEFEKPGSTPPNMIRILSEITPDLAQAFQKICSMRVSIFSIKENGKVDKEAFKEIVIVPFSRKGNKFEKIDLSFDVLCELDSLGVIRFDALNGYCQDDITDFRLLMYAENKYEIISYYKERNFPSGKVLLTDAGEALRKIIEPIEIEGYHEMVKDYMIDYCVQFANINDYIMKKIDGEMTVTKKNNP